MAGLGEKIREKRKGKGLTLRELSGKIDISSSKLQKIEKGRLDPSVNLTIKLCHELDTPIYTVMRDKKKVFVHITEEDQQVITDDKLKLWLVADKGLLSDEMNVSFVEVEKGAHRKTHTESCYVFTYVFEGKIRVNFDGATLEPGEREAVYYDGSIKHSLDALADSQLLNVLIDKSED
jgi:transcriptional regulator with XRE-family HTH domain